MFSPHDRVIFTLTYSDLLYLAVGMVFFVIAYWKWRKWKMVDWVTILIGVIFWAPVIFFLFIDNYVMRM